MPNIQNIELTIFAYKQAVVTDMSPEEKNALYAESFEEELEAG